MGQQEHILMAYAGVSVPIVLGSAGLVTDAPNSELPINALSKANNVTFQNGRVSKQLGNTKLNSTALDSGADIVCLFDYWPTSALQRTIALTDSGKMFRDTGDGTFSSGTAIKTGLGSLTTDAHMMTGGAEYASRNKKLFAFTGSSQIQVLSGDSSAPTALALPSADFATGNYPNFGVLYQNRLCVMNVASNKHQLYFSTVSDHENFVGQNFGNARWELWSRIAATPNVDRTATVQAGSAVTLFTTTNNDGFLAYGVNPFNKITFTISQAATGAPVYTYEYWNGSAWTALTLTTTPTYTAAGSTFLAFTAPSDWAAGDGTEVAGNTAYYAIRALATTAPATAVQATSMTVTNTTYDTAPPTFSVFPGESDGILSAYVYRGMLFIFKKPFGVYVLDGRDPSTANWTLNRYSDSFGVSSPHSICQVLGDLIAGNSSGSITSLQASQSFGDFDAGDILQNAMVEDYIRNQINFTGLPYSQSIYYPEKKIALFTGQSTSTLLRDRMIAVDVGRQAPRISLITKDTPNCLALRKDSQGISRPMYGDTAGFVYLMDQATYNNAGSSYLGEFQTAYTDFGQVDSSLAGKNKIFDFLEVAYVPTGNNDFFVDVYVDGSLRQTLTFSQELGTELDSFVLDVDTLVGEPVGKDFRQPLFSCTGKRISFRVYNNNSNEAFQIERLIVGFRVSAEQAYENQV
jgi:hypothetical protein